jgi:NADPH:quinone reductase-like Zn-dependent oxidoreductase
VGELGADVVTLPENVAEHGPYDVVLELVGGPNIEDSLKSLDIGGRIVVIGVSAGFKAEVNLLAIMGKRATLRGSTLRARPLEEKALVSRAVEREVLPGIASGALKVPVEATFPLAEVDAAYTRFTDGAKVGKIVLTVD